MEFCFANITSESGKCRISGGYRMTEDHKTIEVTGAGKEKELCYLCHIIVNYEMAINCRRKKCPVLALPF